MVEAPPTGHWLPAFDWPQHTSLQSLHRQSAPLACRLEGPWTKESGESPTPCPFRALRAALIPAFPTASTDRMKKRREAGPPFHRRPFRPLRPPKPVRSLTSQHAHSYRTRQSVPAPQLDRSGGFRTPPPKHTHQPGPQTIRHRTPASSRSAGVYMTNHDQWGQHGKDPTFPWNCTRSHGTPGQDPLK